MTIRTRIRNGVRELVPPKGGYKSHGGDPLDCENDWHDNHTPGSQCPECGAECQCELLEGTN